MQFEESYITVDDCRIRMRRAGTGQTILYLHGANGAPVIQPFMQELAQDFNLLVPEHPGFGYSDEPPWLENIHDLAYFYLDFLKHQKLDSVHVIGSSMGGWLAMEMAVREPSRFKSLVLIDAAGVPLPDAQPGDIFLWSAEQMARNLFYDQTLADRVLANPPTSEQDKDALLKNKHTVARLAWQPRLHDPFLSKWLHRLDMPVKLAWGKDDKVMPLAFGQALKKLIPGATLDIYEACGHLPQVEHPARFCASVKSFIEGVR